jgi:hypothetical protein
MDIVGKINPPLTNLFYTLHELTKAEQATVLLSILKRAFCHRATPKKCLTLAMGQMNIHATSQRSENFRELKELL